MLKATFPGLENLSFMVREVCSEATKTKAPWVMTLFSQRNPLLIFRWAHTPANFSCPGRQHDLCTREGNGILGVWESKELGSSSELVTHRMGTLSQATQLLWVLDSYLLNKSDNVAGSQVVLRMNRACLGAQMATGWPWSTLTPQTYSGVMCLFTGLKIRYGLSADKCFSDILNEKLKNSQILPNYYNFWGLTLILSLTQINIFHCFVKADLQLRPQPSVLKTWTFSVEEKCKTDRVWTMANNQVCAQTQAQAWLNCMLTQFQVKDLWASPPWLKGQIFFLSPGAEIVLTALCSGLLRRQPSPLWVLNTHFLSWILNLKIICILWNTGFNQQTSLWQYPPQARCLSPQMCIFSGNTDIFLLISGAVVKSASLPRSSQDKAE